MSVVITKFRKMELVCLLVWIGWKVRMGSSVRTWRLSGMNDDEDKRYFESSSW